MRNASERVGETATDVSEQMVYLRECAQTITEAIVIAAMAFVVLCAVVAVREVIR